MPVQEMRLQHIYRYPVKSLSGQSLDQANLAVGRCLVHDRRYGIVHASSKVDTQHPQWASKKHFLNLARDEKIGELAASYNEEGTKVALYRQGREIVAGDLTTPQGRMVIEGFLSSFMPTGARGHARIADSAQAHFADNPEPYISLINMATITDIERVTRKPLDHRRFRGNLYFTGTRPWQEKQWIGKRLRIGAVEYAVIEEIERCNAINVEPETGKVEVNIPLSLQRGFRHRICGVFLQVVKAGTMNTGDMLEVLADG